MDQVLLPVQAKLSQDAALLIGNGLGRGMERHVFSHQHMQDRLLGGRKIRQDQRINKMELRGRPGNGFSDGFHQKIELAFEKVSGGEGLFTGADNDIRGFVGGQNEKLRIRMEADIPGGMDSVGEGGRQIEIHEDQIRAEFRHGILKIDLPKKKEVPAVEETKYISIE